ncbi:MAG: type I glyceraldehyde-3-phosphate dehydrogenase [Oscillospiraceae bacterium]|jgi:glyceraldehyde 3-phosphate dehydrogenase|nr:type I glyceraldehyde-3-phosphate dehydrogenase [Oscillospiraceae bacterium]
MTEIGINGFGRIGRLALRLAERRDDVRVTAVNDPFLSPEGMAYLLMHDSVHGIMDGDAYADGDRLMVNGRPVYVSACCRPEEIPWKRAGARYVLEATGLFTGAEKAEGHIAAGAEKVLISAPSKDAPMFVMGVNHKKLTGDMRVVSNASCTTNCLAPLAKVINDAFGVENALMTTVHAVTATQKTVDGVSIKDLRAGRSAMENIIPASTGAAKAVGKVLPELAGRLTGIALRVPVTDVSAVDLTVSLKRHAPYAEICHALESAAKEEMKGIIRYTEDKLVSSDVKSDVHSCVFDAGAGLALNEGFMKLIAWYDNEAGYAMRCLDMIKYMSRL